KQVEVPACRGVCLDDFFVQCDSQPWTVRQTEIAVHYSRAASRTLARVRLGEVVEVLLNLEIGAVSGEVQGGCGRDRAADVVRGDGDIVHVGHGGDLLGFEQAAALGDVRLN